MQPHQIAWRQEVCSQLGVYDVQNLLLRIPEQQDGFFQLRTGTASSLTSFVVTSVI